MANDIYIEIGKSQYGFSDLCEEHLKEINKHVRTVVAQQLKNAGMSFHDVSGKKASGSISVVANPV